jgi:hypothetical protein
MEEPEAPRVRLGSGMEAAWASCPERPDATRARPWVASAPKGRSAATRGCCKRVKGTPYEAETRGAACKGVSAVRRHAGGLYDAGSYCYTLVKCLKPFVRNGKCVIGADDHAQGSTINSEPLVMKRAHCNEKRAPKAPASLSAFGLLSVSLFHFLVCYVFPCFLPPSRVSRSSFVAAAKGEKHSGGCSVGVHLRARFPPTRPFISFRVSRSSRR